MSLPNPDGAESLAHALEDYGTGLRAEISLLRQVDDLSKRQGQACLEGQLGALGTIVAERERLAHALTDLEQHLEPLRARLAENVATLAGLPAFQEVSRLHRDASALVSTIMAADGDTLRTLRETGDLRRDAAHALETGEATLAAYRRAVAATPGTAGLVDQRG